MRREQKLITEIAIAAVQMPVNKSSWTDVCDLLNELLGARASMVFAHDLTTHQAILTYPSQSFSTPEALELLSTVKQGGGQEDHAGFAAIGRLSAGEVLGERDAFDLRAEDPLPQNAWRDAVMGVTGANSRSIMRLNDVGPHLDCLITHDDHNSGYGLPSLIEASQWLTPLLFSSLETNRVFASLAQGYERLMTLFDRLDFGAVFCSENGRIIAGNAAFYEMAREKDALSHDGDRLRGTSREAQESLRRVLRSTFSRDEGHKNHVGSFPRLSGMRPLIVRSAAIQDKAVDEATLALLLIIDPEDTSRLSAESLSAFDVLTDAELSICELLIQGRSTPQVAEEREASVQTVRTQIKSATSKLGCNSRYDLLRLALMTTVPVNRMHRNERA